jgi:hypothetical protein
MTDQLTEDVLAEMERLQNFVASSPEEFFEIEQTLKGYLLTHAPALLAAARREQELASEVGVLLSEREDATLERIEHKKRIAELEALLDRVPHVETPPYFNARCFLDCQACAWEKLKGGGK